MFETNAKAQIWADLGQLSNSLFASAAQAQTVNCWATSNKQQAVLRKSLFQIMRVF
jgi:hypothetical protein